MILDEETKRLIAIVREVAKAQATRLFKSELVTNDSYTWACMVAISAEILAACIAAGATEEFLKKLTPGQIIQDAMVEAGFEVGLTIQHD